MRHFRSSILIISFCLLLFSCSKDDSEASGYSLSVEIEPEGAGTVSPGSGTYDQGEIVELNAVAAEGYHFKEWIGDISGENPFYEVSFNSNKDVTAVFEPVLSSRIIGKWEVEASVASSILDNSKSNNKTPCGIIAIQFNSDGTFIITTNGGEIIGTYKFTGVNTIELDKAGFLKKIIWENGTLSFDLNLSDCSGRATVVKWATFVPDDVFEQLLIDMGNDDVLDNYVLTENITGIKSIEYNGEGRAKIQDLTGIRDFKELWDLDLKFNSLPSLDVTENYNLIYLILEGNDLQYIDISHNDRLSDLNLKNNLFKQVKFKDVNPTWISLIGNPLKQVELTNVTLYQLDLNNTSIEKLVLNNFDGGEIYVRNNGMLGSIEFNNSQINFYADFSNNKLKYLDVSGSPKLTYLKATGNNFSCVTVNEDQLKGSEYWEFDEGVTLSLDCD